jgi:hypothetical protein
MVRKFLARFLRGGVDGEERPALITPERVQDLFDYGRRHDVSGIALEESEATGLARLIDWQPDVRDWTIRVATMRFAAGDQIVIPPHIKWSDNPHFRYAGIVDGVLEFRSGDNGESAWFLAEAATEPRLVEQTAGLFEFWYHRLQLDRIGQQAVEDPAGLGAVTRGSPIRGFNVQSVIYPNHTAPGDPPYTAAELAMLLSRSMDLHWFAEEAAFDHFSVSAVQQGNGDNQDAVAFDFGPFDKDADDFVTRCTVIVRETAGGGFMLLVQDTGAEHAARIKALYDALPGDGYRSPGGKRPGDDA